MNEAELRLKLDDCLVEEKVKGQMDIDSWSDLKDPFPNWKQEGDA